LQKSRFKPEDSPNEYRLLLACARKDLSGQQVKEGASAIRAGIDWSLLNRHAQAQGLSPLLYRNLQKHFALEIPPSQDWRGRVAESGVRNLHLSAALVHIVEALRSAGIRALAYKGPASALGIWGDIALREMSDLDILIDPASFQAAQEVLSALEYKPIFAHSRRQKLARLRSDCQCEFFSAGSNVTVDLHWRITAPHLAPRFHFEDLWERRRVLTLGQKTFDTFSNEDTALVLAVHGGKHLWQRLSWLADFAEILRQDIDWEILQSRSREARAERMLKLAIALARDVMRVSVPADCAAAISKDRVVQNLSATIERALFEDSSIAQQNGARWWSLVQLADRRWDSFRCAAHFAFGSGPREWETVRLPDSLFSFYSVVRIARLLRSAPTVLFHGRRAG